MTQAKATARPWRIAHKASDYTYLEQAGGNFLTVAKVTDVVERDANAELIVTAVNEHDALLREVAQLREALESMKQAVEFALTTPGMIRGRDQLKNAVETTGVFAPPLRQRKGNE
jgi:hypothetical protein